jgi:hypothetical protein
VNHYVKESAPSTELLVAKEEDQIVGFQRQGSIQKSEDGMGYTYNPLLIWKSGATSYLNQNKADEFFVMFQASLNKTLTADDVSKLSTMGSALSWPQRNVLNKVHRLASSWATSRTFKDSDFGTTPPTLRTLQLLKASSNVDI